MRWTHVDAMWPLTNNAQRALEAISCNLELKFEYGGNHWKSLDEKNVMEISELGFDMV
jgi:hypothetical protein